MKLTRETKEIIEFFVGDDGKTYRREALFGFESWNHGYSWAWYDKDNNQLHSCNAAKIGSLEAAYHILKLEEIK